MGRTEVPRAQHVLGGGLGPELRLAARDAGPAARRERVAAAAQKQLEVGGPRLRPAARALAGATAAARLRLGAALAAARAEGFDPSAPNLEQHARAAGADDVLEVLHARNGDGRDTALPVVRRPHELLSPEDSGDEAAVGLPAPAPGGAAHAGGSDPRVVPDVSFEVSPSAAAEEARRLAARRVRSSRERAGTPHAAAQQLGLHLPEHASPRSPGRSPRSPRTGRTPLVRTASWAIDPELDSLDAASGVPPVELLSPPSPPPQPGTHALSRREFLGMHVGERHGTPSNDSGSLSFEVMLSPGPP